MAANIALWCLQPFAFIVPYDPVWEWEIYWRVWSEPTRWRGLPDIPGV